MDTRYGYGRHASGFISNAPKTVRFDPKASVSVYFGLPRDNKGWWDGAWKSVFTMWETDELPGVASPANLAVRIAMREQVEHERFPPLVARLPLVRRRVQQSIQRVLAGQLLAATSQPPVEVERKPGHRRRQHANARQHHRRPQGTLRVNPHRRAAIDRD